MLPRGFLLIDPQPVGVPVYFYFPRVPRCHREKRFGFALTAEGRDAYSFFRTDRGETINLWSNSRVGSHGEARCTRGIHLSFQARQSERKPASAIPEIAKGKSNATGRGTGSGR